MLAHLIADYPLQSDKLVAAKMRLPGLTLHVAIHWIVMTILTWPVRVLVWPYILAITFMHFSIDYFKVVLNRRRPEWVIGPYLWDQPLHWLSLIIACTLMGNQTNLPIWNVTSPWWIYGIGLLIATHIWYITERVLTYRDKEIQPQIRETMWPRMFTRLLFYSGFAAATPWSLLFVIILFGAAFFLYDRFQYPRRWLVTDILVGFGSALIVLIILALF